MITNTMTTNENTATNPQHLLLSLRLCITLGVFLIALSHSFYSYAEEQHDEHETSALVLSTEQLNHANISLAKVGSATISETLSLYGVVTVNAEHVYKMSARFPGVVHSIHYKVGDAVQPNAILAEIESNESLKNYTLTSSVRGTITERNINNKGEQTPDGPLFVITDLANVWVEIAVFPRDFAKIHIGQTVQVQQTQTSLVAEGKIIYISPTANSANQTLSARVLIDNNQRQWIPGSYVSAHVILAQTAVPLAIQNDAIQTLEEKNVVFVQEHDGFKARPVQLGRSDLHYTEVLNGLAANDIYAVKNSFIFKSDLGKEGAEHAH